MFSVAMMGSNVWGCGWPQVLDRIPALMPNTPALPELLYVQCRLRFGSPTEAKAGRGALLAEILEEHFGCRDLVTKLALESCGGVINLSRFGDPCSHDLTWEALRTRRKARQTRSPGVLILIMLSMESLCELS